VRGRRGFVTGALVVALIFAALVGPALARRVAHHRDQAAFSDYVATYVGGWSSSADPGGPQRDLTWVRQHPDELVAEGDRACHWLAQRPAAPPVDPSRAFSVDALAEQYVSRPPASAPPLSAAGYRTLVEGAWQYLCWSDRRARTAPAAHDPD
jgi:hypothetical protein